MEQKREFVCLSCGHKWSLPYGTGRPQSCPKCNSPDIVRSDQGRGFGGGRGRGGSGRGLGRGQVR